ncbi:MAG: hypothetical protein U1E81_17965 [Xanthobacteraceae bacterium]
MQTEVDLLKLSPHQREVLTALVRKLPKSEIARLLKIVEMVTPSPGVVSEATKQAVLGSKLDQWIDTLWQIRFKAPIGRLEWLQRDFG